MYPTTTATLPPPTPPPPDRSGRRWTRRLLTAGALAGPLFVAAFLVEGATRPHYDPVRHPVSSLALGGGGWVQQVAFVFGGLLSLALALGLRRALRGQPAATWGPLLVAVWGLGLIGAGLFLTDPVSGYPPGTPDRSDHHTVHGALHDVASLVGFVALTAACFAFSRAFARRGRRGWAAYSAASGIGFPAALVLASAAFAQNAALVGVGGLVQRAMVVIGWSWLTLLALRTRRDLR